ncbi:MAG TPA: DNA polymerase I [Cytophagales bacterium]|nr:DNA polymerase I [Cytophagales bacterium]
MADKPKLFLLDAMALIYRAHFAFSKNPRVNSKGMNTGAVLGFTNTVLDVLKKENPTHIGVVYDPKGPTFRHEEFPAYKAQREETPEDIVISIPITKDVCAAFDIPVLEVAGFEADDVIGTLAKKACQEGFEVYMMTPDKDYGQLVEDHIFLYKPAYMGNAVDVLGPAEVKAKWDIAEVDQVRDILGLMGDASDNIPGIPGIGAKTAAKLIKQFGSVEELVKNTDQLKGKQKEKVIEFGQQGVLSKHLATIVQDVDIAFEPDKLERSEPKKDLLKPLFEELEFRTLARRVLGEEIQNKQSSKADTSQLDMFSAPAAGKEEAAAEPIEYKTLDTTEHRYHLMDTKELRQELLEFLLMQDEVCFDTETDRLESLEAELVGMSFAYVAGEAYYVPVPEGREAAQAIVDDFRPFFENDNIIKVGQNLKYDIKVLKKYNIAVAGPYLDTMLAHYLIDPETRHNMDVLAENFLHYKPVSITSLIGPKGKKQKTMRDVPVHEVAEYASEDADITLQLKQKLAPELDKFAMKDLAEKLEFPLLDVLGQMEAEGVRVDENTLSEISTDLGNAAGETEKRIYELAGEEFNLASPKQLGPILFDKLKLVDKPKKTKTGQYATGEEVLAQLSGEHEIAAKILEWRELVKLKNTYVDALPALISETDGRIHTTFNQTVAATGRLSSVNPNLQNIPIRTARGRQIRKAFVPRGEEFTLMAADYSQIELRIMADFANDEHMIEAFQNGRDIHATTAAKIFKEPLEEVTTEQRRRAKTANFGIIYGISAFGLSQRLNIPRGEASEIIKSYFAEFPAVKEYMDKVINDARDQQYVQTLLGRRRYLRDINSRNQTIRGMAERNAINAPIQGSAADIIKKAMLDVNAWMKAEKVKSIMTLQVHDELVFDVHQDEVELMKTEIPRLMAEALPLKHVPMVVEVGFGDTWLDAH